MPGQTKMIIITTDNDIIRRFSLNTSANTQIINLDHNSEENLPKKNTSDDIINLSLLAEISTVNSSNDQMYKRALDSTDTVPSKPVKTSRRSIDMICAICGDKAIGYNYDVLSCGSCKAFFRRNANKTLESLKCLTRVGQCLVAHDIHQKSPKCPKCRLERCLTVGMRKDFIIGGRGNPQKQNITTNEREFPLESDELDRLFNGINEDNDQNLFDDTLAVEDWLVIENVRSAFSSVFENAITTYPSYDCADSTSALINWTNSANENALNFIKFFRQINEFEALDADDRLILIKYNLFPVYPILKCFYFHTEMKLCEGMNEEEQAKFHRFYTLCCGSYGTHQAYLNLVLSLIAATDQDTTVLSLLLVILMFSQGLSMNEDEPLLKDQIQVSRAQSHYIQVLWNYMIHKWGDIEAHKHFTQLLSVIFRMQTTSKMLRETFRNQLITSNAADQIAPTDAKSVKHFLIEFF